MQPRVIDGGVLTVHRLGGEQPDVDMLCGSFHYNRQSLLFDALPDYLVVSSRQWRGDGQLAALIALLRSGRAAIGRPFVYQCAVFSPVHRSRAVG